MIINQMTLRSKSMFIRFYIFLHIFLQINLITSYGQENEPSEDPPQNVPTTPEAAKEILPVNQPNENDVGTSVGDPISQLPKVLNPSVDSIRPLDNLPKIPDFFGIDLRTGAYIITALSIVHIFFYGCTLFMRLSYLLVTIWVLIMLYTAFSIVLFISLQSDSLLPMHIWLWYALIFVVLMVVMMILFSLVFCMKGEYQRLIIVFLGLLWYALTVYFILVVNSYRMELESNSTSPAASVDVLDDNIARRSFTNL